jgi:hypothetical protein
MEMKNPPHPGELIGDTLDKLKVSIVERPRAVLESRGGSFII